MMFVKLRDGECSDQIAHFFPSLDGTFDKPLDHRVDMDEVQPLDLVRLDAVGTFHSWKDGYDLLR